MSRKALVLAAVIGGAAVFTACTPPPATRVELDHATCFVSHDTDRTFGTIGAGCGTDVDIPCGPMLATHAEDDVCVAYYDTSAGRIVIGPLSSMQLNPDAGPVDIRTGGPYL